MRLSTVQIKANKQEVEPVFGIPGNARLCGSRVRNQRGFTLVELITIIMILGVISAVAASRFFDRDTFASRGFYDQVISTLRFAQKTAVAQHRLVCVAFAADSMTLTIDSTVPPDGVCDAAPAGDLTSPTGETPFFVPAPIGVTFTAPAAGTVLNFDGLGRPGPGATPAISVAGYSTAITVEAETGYVH